MTGVLEGIASTVAYYIGYETPVTAAATSSTQNSVSSSSHNEWDDEVLLSTLYPESSGVHDYFNLGASSFPLLPHDGLLFSDPLVVDDKQHWRRASTASTNISSSRSSHHFSSILNDPRISDDSDESVALPLSVSFVSALAEDEMDTQQVNEMMNSLGRQIEIFQDNHPMQQMQMHVLGDDNQQDNPADRDRELNECLSIVPSAYFSPNYSLQTDPLFLSHIQSLSVGPVTLASRQSNSQSNLALQATLSAYLDQVEVNLFRQINARSPLLFSALNTIDSVHGEVSACLSAIAAIRQYINSIHHQVSDAGLTIVEYQQQVDSLTGLLALGELINTVMQTQSTVQLLLSSGDYSSCLLLLHSARQCLDGELKGIRCVRNVDIKLREQSKMVEKLMEHELIQILIQHTEREQLQHGEDDSRTVRVIHRQLNEEHKEKARIMMEHLLRLGNFNSIITTYKRELMSCIKQRLTSLVYKHIDTVVTEELEDPTITTNHNSSNNTASAADTAASTTADSTNTVPMENTQTTNATTAESHTQPQTPTLTTAPTPTDSARISPLPASPHPSVPSPSTSSSSSPTNQHDGNTAATSTSTSGNSLTTRLQALTHRQFIDFLSPLLSALMDPIYRAADVQQLLTLCIKQLTQQAEQKQPSSAVLDRRKELQSVVLSFSDMLSSCCELLHLKLSKLLQTRQTIHSHLSLNDFKELLDLVLSFLHESESLCKKPFYGLRGALLGQAKGFVANFHSACMSTLTTALETEKWNRVDVEYEYQQLIDSQFAHRAPHTTETERRMMNGQVDAAHPASTTAAASNESESTGSSSSSRWSFSSGARADRKVLFVPVIKPPGAAGSASSSPNSSTSNFMKFPVVRSLLILLSLCADYVDLSTQLPALTLDTLHRLLELLTLFNSRTCQLVLGAGAMHLAGLRSITATHLALSSQCIALLATQLPALKQVFLHRLSVKHAVFCAGFDRIQTDCEEHVTQIREKLIIIMRELIETQTKKMSIHIINSTAQQQQQQQDELEEDEDPVSPAIRTLMKQTCSLHRALTDLLSTSQRNLIFGNIGDTMVNTFITACGRVIDTTHNTTLSSAEQQRLTSKRRVLLQANGLHIIVRMRTLVGVDQDKVRQLTQWVEQLT